MTELHEHLTAAPADVDLEGDDARERWHIDSDDLATWAGRKLGQAEGEMARIKAIAATEIERIEAWRDAQLRIAEHDVDFFTSKLIEYRRSLEATNPKLPKTYKLPTVSLKRRAGRESTRVTNQTAFIEWATTYFPDAVKVTRSPLVSALGDLPRDDNGQLVADGGEIVPGVESSTAPDTYAVDVVDLWAGEPF